MERSKFTLTSIFFVLIVIVGLSTYSEAKHPKLNRKATFLPNFPFDLNNEGLSNFFKRFYQPASAFKAVNFWFTSLLSNIESYLRPQVLREKRSLETKVAAADYPYWKFIPGFVVGVFPDGPSVSWSAPCFTENTAKATWDQKGDEMSITIHLSVGEPSSFFCNDYYLFGTMSSFSVQSFFSRGNHKLELNYKNLTEADKYDITANGVRIFRFTVGETEALESVFHTAMLFVPALLNQAVPAHTAEENLNFLASYAGIKMEKREITDVQLNESDVHSGDFFGIIRLDGLDPMLAWGMGAGTGHTAIALRIDGELYICESTTVSKYWPTDGIQKTPFKQWLKQAKAASYNVVHLPLSPEARAMFDEKKAVEWFQSKAIGLPYGFHNMLLTWLDTPRSNLPCLPPDYKTCLSPELVQIVAGLVDKYDHTISQLMFNQALNKRIGNDKPTLSTVEVMLAAGKKGLKWTDLTVMPEQDSWVYTDGYSMVCCVFVCETWKAAGVFGNLTDQIQCTEFTNWDAYSLAVFDTKARPAACVTADPDLPYCQILGENRVHLPGFNSKTPYAHMAERCPSEAPDYQRPSNC